MAKKTTPKYRYHKARKCAVVTINGRDHYLGEHYSAPSLEKYHRLIAESLAEPQVTSHDPAETPLTVTELIAQYWDFDNSYYVKNGQPTSEVSVMKLTLRFVHRLYGVTPASEFSPKRLKAVREAMIITRSPESTKSKAKQ